MGITPHVVENEFGSGAQREPVTDPEAYAVYESVTFGKAPVVLLWQLKRTGTVGGQLM